MQAGHVAPGDWIIWRDFLLRVEGVAACSGFPFGPGVEWVTIGVAPVALTAPASIVAASHQIIRVAAGARLYTRPPCEWCEVRGGVAFVGELLLCPQCAAE